MGVMSEERGSMGDEDDVYLSIIEYLPMEVTPRTVALTALTHSELGVHDHNKHNRSYKKHTATDL